MIGEANSLEKLQKIMNDDNYRVGYCDLHQEPIDQGTFEYKGCWTCWQHFRWKDWIYISTAEAAKQYNVSVKTIHRWIKRGKLKGRLFTMGRDNPNVPKKFYAILPNQPKP